MTLRERWLELRERLPDDDAELDPDLLREAIGLYREAKAVATNISVADARVHGEAMWVVGRMKAWLFNGEAPAEQVLGPVTVEPLTREQVLQYARENWEDPAGFHAYVLAHMHITDEAEYEPVDRDALTDAFDEVASHVVDEDGSQDALQRLRTLIERAVS
jgi:hypothetical protein